MLKNYFLNFIIKYSEMFLEILNYETNIIKH